MSDPAGPPFEFRTSWFARVVLAAGFIVTFTLAAYAVLVGIFVLGMSGERGGGGLLALAGTAACGFAASLWLGSRLLARVAELTVDADGLTARRSGELARFFVPWSRVRGGRITRLKVSFRYVDEAGKAGEILLVVPWRRTEDVVRLKNYALERLAISPSSPPSR